MYSLNTPIEKLTRVGKATSRLLNKLDIFQISDLLYYFPSRYDDFSNFVPIKELVPNQQVTIKGKIILITNRRSFRRRLSITEALLEDNSGTIKAIWFNQPFLVKNLHIGDEIYLSGKVESDKLGLQFVSPVYEKVNSFGHINTGKIVPVYPLTERLTQKQLRFLINFSLPCIELMAEWLPDYLLTKYKFLPLAEALREIHFPSTWQKLEQARYRLQFEELFIIQLQSQLTKKFLEQTKAPQITFLEQEIKDFVSSLPFSLTNDQRKASWQILQDLGQNKPMNRLLEGDVGSGKTMVAAIAMLNVALNRFQAVLMAPTEILARQHYQSLLKFFASQKLKIALLTRVEKSLNNEAISKTVLLKAMAAGKVAIIIGTQAMIQEDVKYKNLGLVIIDEQHRFGVEQRKALKEKNLHHLSPHFLSMTATPIPRTLALIVYGDLDLSLIKEMPKGRKKIITKIIPEKERQSAYNFIRQEVASGRQVFVICPLIDPSDKLGVKSVTEEFKKLDKEVFPDLAIGLLHGKLKASEKEQVMQDFKANRLKILVSTSVVEVGIDVPNATIMMIEGSQRFGLAQLHQFRGRVGRGEHQSYCLLFTDNNFGPTGERLANLVRSNDGFALAEADLKFRGPGEVFGAKQSGLPNLRIADLNNLELITLAQKEAQDFFQNYKLSQYPEVEKKLKSAGLINHWE